MQYLESRIALAYGEVIGRFLFYDNSAFDSGPGSDAMDVNAIATDKSALLPGDAATFQNYTSYSRGINGIMIDVVDLANPSALTIADFRFLNGNSNDLSNWDDAPDPVSITVGIGEGDEGADRISLIWPDNQIYKEWLQVTLQATAATGLETDDVFYFGNAIGDTGNSSINSIVNAADEIGARNNPHSFLNPAAIDDVFDFNRDSRVNAADQIIARNNQTFFLNALQLITAPEPLFEEPLELSAANLMSLSVNDIDFLTPPISPDDPVAILRDATLTFTNLPGDLGEVSIQIASLDGYDDNDDGIIDGFGLSTTINLSDVDFSLGGETLLAFAGLTLGVNDLEIRPMKESGFRAGELVFDASGVAFLPTLAPINPVNTIDPRVGSIDLHSGAFSFALDLPLETRRSMTASGWVPFEVTHVAGTFDPSGPTPDVAFSLSGLFELDKLVDELGTAIGSPNLAVEIEAYDATNGSFAPISSSDPLTFSVSYLSGEFRLSGTPALKANVANVEIDLGESLGTLSLDGFLAVGGFDSVGLPAPMPAELGEPFAGQQVVGSLTVVSTSGIGELTGEIVIGGTRLSSGGISQLDLVGQATLEGDFDFSGVTATGTIGANFGWEIDVDNSQAAFAISGVPTVSSIQFQNVDVTVPNLAELNVGLIEYQDPIGLGPDDPVAILRDATLTFTSLPGDLGEVSIQIASLDGYDDNDDGIIDGFGLSTTIDLSDVDFSLGGETLLAFAGLTLGVNGLLIRPMKESGTRAGELVLDATGIAFLPSLAPINPVNTTDPRVGSIDLQSGAFSFALDLPEESRRALTASGWVPFEVTHVAGTFDPSGPTPDVSFSLSGLFDLEKMVDELGTAIGSPNLAVEIEAYDATTGSFEPISLSDPLTFDVSYVSGEFRLSGTPALKANVANVEIDLGESLGTLSLDGFLAVGGFDSVGLPAPMPAELGEPFAGQQVVGSLTVVSTSGIGELSGEIVIGGTLQSNAGISQLDLVGQATLEGDLSFLDASGSLAAEFAWPLTVDNSSGTPSFSGAPELLNLTASSLVMEVENVVRLDIAEVTYTASPGAGEPVATATGATITLLGIFDDANLSGSADLELFDDNSDGVIDGVKLAQLSLSFAPDQTWDYVSGGEVLLRAMGLTATLSDIEYRPALSGFQPAGTIDLAVGQLSLYPDGNGAFTSTINDVQGSIHPADGDVSLDIGELSIGLGPDQGFQLNAANILFQLDDDDATDIFSVETASLTILDDMETLSTATFEATDLRFNLIDGQPKFGLGGVQLEAAQGVLGTLGLAGFLPLDVTDASLSFASDGEGYTDFTNFTFLVDGYFDLSLIESMLPFEPILSIGETSAAPGGNPHMFTGIEIGFDIEQGRITPINLSDIRVGFSEWAIGELVFAGEMLFAGYVDGQLDPTVSGTFGIDVESGDNRVQPTSGSGFDFHGAEITLTGSIAQTLGLTTIVIDAQVDTTFDLKLGDFLELSDLGFSFGVDITATDDFLEDPLNRVVVEPRLEQMTVGTLTAGIGDYFSLGAVPGSGGGPGLLIDFDPQPGEPLVVLNFQVQSSIIGLSGTIENLAILSNGVPDFAAIDQINVELVSRGDGSPSLLQDLFAEFLPLSVSKIGLKFEDGFFALDDDEQIVGIDDPTALNLIVSGRAGTPSWMPEDFLFEVGSDFSNLEIDVAELLDGQFPIVSLGGLGFEVGIDFGAFKIGGGLSVGVVDADPTTGVAPVYYLAVEGGLVVAGYGATGAIALTTAGPIGATLSVPLAIPLAQSGFLISGAAGTIQFGTSILPDPEDIQRPSDLGAIPNPFSIDLSSVPAIEGIIHGLWDEAEQIVRPTWTEPVTLALQGELTHVAVAGMISGTATVAANLTLPIGGTSITDGGLALLGFGELQAMGIPLAEAKIVFDLRDELNPSFGFHIQAPAYGNPLGMVFPAQADFGILLRTDGLAMATAIGLRAMFTELAAGAMEQGQLFFETVASQLLEVLQLAPEDSALTEALSPYLLPGQDFLSMDSSGLVALIRNALEFDDVLNALSQDGGQSVEQLSQSMQTKLASALTVADALVKDLITFGPQVIALGLDDGLSVGEQMVAIGLRTVGQQNDPLDPLALLSKLELGVDRLIPIEFISEFTSILVNSVGRGVQEALLQTAAFIVSDSFNPRLLIEGAIQPTLMGVPVGEPPASVQMSISKQGVSYGLNVSVIRTLQLLGTTAYTGPLGLLLYSMPAVADETTIAYELPFNALDALQDLTDGGLPLGALNPFSPEWGQLTMSELSTGSSSVVVSMAQFGPGSTLLENNVQIVDDFDDPADPGKIPVTSQELLDRMLDLGGFLMTGGVLQSKLLADPFEVIQGILDSAALAGEQLEDADGEMAYLFQLFSTVPAFLESVQDSLIEMEELARVQAYLPISYATLLPQSLQDLLDGDPEAFNEAFQATFFDSNGAIREDAVQAFFAALVAEIENSASTIASNMYLEGVLNGKLLGIELANGRVFAGVLPDPDNPGETVNFGNSAITVTGAIPWLGGLEVVAVLDQQLLALPEPPAEGDDPLAALRLTFGDSIAMPRGTFELGLDTSAEPGEESDFEKVMTAFGLDPSLFQLPVDGQANASVRAYTPGYDLSSEDPIQRVGGLEFLANLSIPNVVDDAAFRFRATSPSEGPNGMYLPFSGKASVASITLGGLTITDAVLDVVSDETGIRVAVSGEAEVLGAMFTVDGELNSQFQGNLTLTLKSGETLARAFGGLSGEGTFSLVLTGPTSGSIAFTGTLSNVPGVLGNLTVEGVIQTNGDFSLSSQATNVTLAGFFISNASLTIARTREDSSIQFAGGGTTSALGASFVVSGSLSTSGVGTLSLALSSGTPSFGGLTGSGSFNLNLTSPSSGSIGFTGNISSVPGKGSSSLSMSGSIASNGNFTVSSSATGLSLGGFSISSANVAVSRTGSTTTVSYSGTASMSLLGASFQAAGSLSTTGSGTLSLTKTSGTTSFGGLTGSGTFNLNLTSPTSGSVSFTGSLASVPGKGSSSLSMSGSISSNGNFTVSSSATSLSLGGFSISSATVAVSRTGSTTTVSYSGTASMSLLGASFQAAGSLSTTGSGTLSLTKTSGTTSFGGLTGSGTFNLNLTSPTSGSVSFIGSLSSVPGKGSSSLSMSGSISSNGNFSVSSSATGLSLGGFSISSANVAVSRTGSTTTVSYSGTASMSLLGASFQAAGSLSTSGSGTLSLTKTSGTTSFGGLTGSGTFNLNLTSPTSGSVSFTGSLSSVPGKGSSSLSMSGSIASNGNFTVSSSATGLSLGGFSISSANVAVSRTGSTTTVSYSGTASMSLLGASFQAAGSFSTSGSGTLSLTKTSGTTSFGGLTGSGTFSLNLTSPTSGSVSFSGSLSSVPGKGSSSLSMSGSISSNGNFSVSSSATGLSLGGFSISSANVAVSRTGSTTTVSYSGTASMSLLGASFRASGNLSTSGAGNLSLTKTSGTTSFGGLTGSGTFNLNLTSPTSGSVSFTGSLSSVPGKGSSTLSMSGSISSNGNFSVSSSATSLSLGGFSISSANVAVSRTGSTTTVSYSGTASMSLLGASFRAAGNLSTSGVGTLSLTKTSGTTMFLGLTGTGTFQLNLTGPTSGSVGFSGTLSNVASGFVSSLSVSGNIQSNGNFSVSGSTSITRTVEVLGYDIARVTGTFNATITQSSFSGSITGASLQHWGFNFATGNFEWLTLASGTASINSNGSGSIGVFGFGW